MTRALVVLSFILLPGCTDRATSDADSANGSNSCPDVEVDVDAFLEDHRSCQTDDDCTLLGSQCRVDDCSEITVNQDASFDEWRALDEALAACAARDEAQCNYVGECGFDIECTPQGRCAPVR